MEKSQIEIAKELGIENAESLTAAQLKKAIDVAKGKLEAFNALKLKAQVLGIVFPEDITEEDLLAEISATEEAFEAQRILDEFTEKAHALIDGTIGFERFEELSAEELVDYLKSKMTDEASEIEVEVSGKTDKTIKFKGIDYGFVATAPASFRFMGFVKTQEEWIADDDAMELMVSGNLSYVKPVKK